MRPRDEQVDWWFIIILGVLGALILIPSLRDKLMALFGQGAQAPTSGTISAHNPATPTPSQVIQNFASNPVGTVLTFGLGPQGPVLTDEQQAARAAAGLPTYKRPNWQSVPNPKPSLEMLHALWGSAVGSSS